MNNTIFRTIDFWKSAVMTMPDNSFFELLKSVFGKIKTPFNKQQLLKDLETFLLREDIQKTIAAYIDENDAKVIATTALFGEPAPQELENFFCGELSSVQLLDIIVNLEERFILYRFKEENKSRLALNPILEQILLPFTQNISILFSAVSKAEVAVSETASQQAASQQAASQQVAGQKIILDDRILAGLLSFVSQWESAHPAIAFFKPEGGLRRQINEAGKSIFPGIDLEQVIGTLQILGLFRAEGDKLVHDKKLFDDFALLSPRQRMEYCTAALLVYDETKMQEILPPVYRNRIREIANFAHRLLDFLDTQFLYTEKTLKRMAEVLKARTGTNININLLLEALEKMGLIAAATSELKQFVCRSTEKQESPSIAIDSGFSVLVYPELNFTDAIVLAAFLNIKEAGAVVRFELEKESAVRAFNNNKNADEIIDLLMRLSGGRVEESLIWNLKEWEKRYGEVSLKKGIVLTLTEDKRYILETLPAEMVSETLAPGVYLLNENAESSITSALGKAGIDIIARRTAHEKKSSVVGYSQFPPPSASLNPQEKIPAAGIQQPQNQEIKTSSDNHSAEMTAELNSILKKMPLADTERAELSARIQRRLVLCEAQLKDASLRYEKLEARHMDYMGKQNVAKQAITQQSPVEIVWPNAGEEKRIFGIPKTLEKKEKDLIFVVVPAGEEEPLRIPLAKISLLRRIKKSIFEN